MKAIVVTDKTAGKAGVKLVERPAPQAAINDVVVQIHASGFTGDELSWPSTWTDRAGRDRTPSIPGHELAGVVTALGYGTTGLSIGQRVFGLTDWYRDGTLAEYVAVEARTLTPLPGDVDFTEGAALVMSGLTAWQGLFEHGRLQAGQSVLVHGAAGVVGSMASQLAREAGAYVIGTGRASGRQTALDFGAQEFVDLDNDVLEDVGEVDLVFDVIGGDIAKRSAGLIRAGGTLVTITGPTEARPVDGLTVDFVVLADRAQLTEIVRRARDGRVRTNIGNVATLDNAVAAFNPTERTKGKTIIRVHPRDSGVA
jgi:NADPH:quinone reductase-like Zn-dependent oxidoreductase